MRAAPTMRPPANQAAALASRIMRVRAARSPVATGSSCSSQARMPASATADAIAEVDQLRRVVPDVEALADEVGVEAFEAGQCS